MAPRASQYVEAFRTLEGVSFVDTFRLGACVMRSVPFIMRAAYRSAMRIALKEVMRGKELNCVSRVVEEARPVTQAHQLYSRRSRPQRDEEERHSDRGRSLEQLGEMSAARGALEAASVAPGTMATSVKLTDPLRRPPVAGDELCQEVVNSAPERLFQLDPVEFLLCARTARQGAATGPLGMTADHLFPIPEDKADSLLLLEAVSGLATGDVPTEIIEGLRLGRLTALQKPDGGVREIVVGDIVRRLVASTLTMQVSKQAEKATAPTGACCGCTVHIVQTLRDLDSNATMVACGSRSANVCKI